VCVCVCVCVCWYSSCAIHTVFSMAWLNHWIRHATRMYCDWVMAHLYAAVMTTRMHHTIYVYITHRKHSCLLLSTLMPHTAVFGHPHTAVYVWHNAFICVTSLSRMCTMTHSYVWRDSFICATCCLWTPTPCNLHTHTFLCLRLTPHTTVCRHPHTILWGGYD